MDIERRRFARYVVQENGFEIFGRDQKIAGKLKNISSGGLAYEYAPVNDEEVESEFIDIVGTDPGRFYLVALRCRTVYDTAMLIEDRTFTGSPSRLRGLQFKGLTEEQTRKLESLLEELFVKSANR